MLIKHITEISDFKKREIEYELRNEPDDLKNRSMFNYGIHFDGKDKPWKVVSNRKHADAIANTLRNRGKDVEVRFTRSPVSEAEEAKRNPTQTYNLRGKYKTTVTKSGDSMRPVWHASIEGHDLGKFSSEKAAIQAASKWIDTEKNSVSETEEPTTDKSARAKLDHSLRAQGHKVEKPKKGKGSFKRTEKHKGRGHENEIH